MWNYLVQRNKFGLTEQSGKSMNGGRSTFFEVPFEHAITNQSVPNSSHSRHPGSLSPGHLPNLMFQKDWARVEDWGLHLEVLDMSTFLDLSPWLGLNRKLAESVVTPVPISEQVCWLTFFYARSLSQNDAEIHFDPKELLQFKNGIWRGVAMFALLHGKFHPEDRLINETDRDFISALELSDINVPHELCDDLCRMTFGGGEEGKNTWKDRLSEIAETDYCPQESGTVFDAIRLLNGCCDGSADRV